MQRKLPTPTALALVAQLDRASVSGTEGRAFEPHRVHTTQPKTHFSRIMVILGDVA